MLEWLVERHQCSRCAPLYEDYRAPFEVLGIAKIIMIWIQVSDKILSAQIMILSVSRGVMVWVGTADDLPRRLGFQTSGYLLRKQGMGQ